MSTIKLTPKVANEPLLTAEKARELVQMFRKNCPLTLSEILDDIRLEAWHSGASIYKYEKWIAPETIAQLKELGFNVYIFKKQGCEKSFVISWEKGGKV